MAADVTALPHFQGSFYDPRRVIFDSAAGVAQTFTLSRNLPLPENINGRKYSTITPEAAPILEDPQVFPSDFPAPSDARLQSRDHTVLQSPRTHRGKPHVQAACASCKKAHLACDEGRPCRRCRSHGKGSACVNVEHKKRGRPRLRDDHLSSVTRGYESQPSPAAPAQGPKIMPWPTRSSSGAPSIQPHNPCRFPNEINSTGTPGLTYANLASNFAPFPLAFLSTDVEIVKTNQAFRAIFPAMQLQGRKLFDIVDSSSWRTLEYIQRQLRDERLSKDNTYLPPVHYEHAAKTIPEIDVTNIDMVTHSHVDRTQPLNFRLFAGQAQTLTVSIRLAKAVSYFVVMCIVPDKVPDESLHGRFPSHAPQPPPFQDATAYSYYPSHSCVYPLTPDLAPQQIQTHVATPYSLMQHAATLGRSDSCPIFMSDQAVPRSMSQSLRYPRGMSDVLHDTPGSSPGGIRLRQDSGGQNLDMHTEPLHKFGQQRQLQPRPPQQHQHQQQQLQPRPPQQQQQQQQQQKSQQQQKYHGQAWFEPRAQPSYSQLPTFFMQVRDVNRRRGMVPPPLSRMGPPKMNSTGTMPDSHDESFERDPRKLRRLETT